MSVPHIVFRKRGIWLVLVVVYILLASFTYTRMFAGSEPATTTTTMNNFTRKRPPGGWLKGFFRHHANLKYAQAEKPPAEAAADKIIEEMVGNTTLGFGEIMYVSMPERTDRQDAMTVLASYTNLTLVHIPGVHVDSIPANYRPKGSTHLNPGIIGCWRAHANAWRRLLTSSLETALVLEDDIDWDVNIKDIMHTLSMTMRTGALRLTAPTAHETAAAPYGLDWDVLWIGACIHTVDSRAGWVVYDDRHAPTRAGTRQRDGERYFKFFNETYPVDGGVRILSHAGRPACTMGYAITRKGAQKLLFHVGQKGLSSPVDLSMGSLHRQGKIWGYEVHPQVVTEWHTGAPGDSDIDALQVGEEEGEKGKKRKAVVSLGTNMRNSARKAMAKEWDSEAVDHWNEVNKMREESEGQREEAED